MANKLTASADAHSGRQLCWPVPARRTQGSAQASVAAGRVGLTGGFRGASIGASIYGSYRGAAPLSMAPLEEPLLYLWPL
jgi:hypothetical protein